MNNSSEKEVPLMNIDWFIHDQTGFQAANIVLHNNNQRMTLIFACPEDFSRLVKRN